MTTFTDWDIIRNLLLAGRWTVLLSLVAFTGGALVTLPLLLLRLTGGRQVKRLIRGYIELFQGTPLLMQLFLAFFGVALFGVDVSAWTAASVALTLYTSAFLLDIWFGSIRALPKGQWEASRCLGLSFGQTLYRVAQFRMKIAMGTQARSTGCRFALLLHIAKGDLFHTNAWLLCCPESVSSTGR